MARLYLGVAALYGGICGCHGMGGLSVMEQHMQNRRELMDAQSVDDAHRVQPGQCGVYKRGNAELALCVDSAAQYGQDTRQVNGFLVNRGNTPVCDLKVLPVLPGGARLLSSWPDWGLNAQYAYSFNPQQVTAVGLTSTVGADSGAPWVEVVNFRECASVGEKDATSLSFRVVPLGQIRPQSFAKGDKGAILSRLETTHAPPPPPQQQQQQPHQGTSIPEGQCAQYTSPTHANAEATLCIESVLRWAKDVVQVNGFLTNTGKVPLCGVKLVTAPGAVTYSVWPEWTASGTSWEKDFAVGQTIAAGLTAPGAQEGYPPLTVEEFYPCEQPRPPTPQRLMVRQVPIAHEFAHTRSDKEFDDKVPAEHPKQSNGEPRLQDIRNLLASAEVFAKDGRTMPVTARTELTTSDAMAAVTNFAVPDGQCGVYNTGNAELALCTDSTVQWGKDVTQINGFMTNRGSSPICELKVRAVLSSTSQLLSFWPDWAHKSSYSTNFSPGQASAVGLTATPPTDGVAPYIEVVSLRDCSVRGVGPVAFKKVPIASVQPQPPAPMSSSTMPPASKQRVDFNPLQLQLQQQLQPGFTIPEGKCGVYSVAGEGKLALCVESLLRWGQDVTQVNGFLENVGGTHLCDIKVRSENADTTYSVWPEWVQTSAWKDDFAPKQVTAVGLTAPGGDHAHPSLVVESFNVCGQKPSLLGRQPGKPRMEIMDISQVKMLAEQPEKGRRLSTPTAAEASDAHAVPPNRCKTFANGAAKLAVCTQEASHWGQSVMSVGGWVENVGDVPVCNVRLGNTFPEPLTLSVWPSGLVRDQIPAGQRLHTGFTGESRPDGLSSPAALTVVGFTECGAPAAQANAVPTVIGTGRSAFVKYESMKSVETDDGAVAAGDARTTKEGGNAHDGQRQLKQQQHQHEDDGSGGGGGDKQRTPTEDIDDSGAPTTLQNINWDDCGYYNGKDGQSELALCWKSAKAWKNKKAGRVVQANLVVVNTGQVGVCNVTVEIENVDRELGDHYPKMIDEETGEDMFPSYPGYFAPQQILNIGAAVPKGSGYPDVGIDPSFTACSETPKKEKPRNSTCQPYEDQGVKLNFCVYDKLKIWVEYQGPRMVMVEGFVENIGDTTACNITVDIDGLATAKATWGEWMPTYPYKLQPTDVLKFGANIPWKHGVPKASLTKFENCSRP